MLAEREAVPRNITNALFPGIRKNRTWKKHGNAYPRPIDRIAVACLVGSQNERKIGIAFLYENIDDTEILPSRIFSAFTSIKSYPMGREK